MLSRETYLETLNGDARSFGELLRRGDLTTSVPDCPGWSLADLARHLGGVHRWAHAIVTTGSPGEEPTGPDAHDELMDWFDAGAAQLLDALSSADLQTPVWTFGPKPRLVAFWVRRQPHETSMHLRDARRATGAPHALDIAFAVDGVDEVVTMFVPRQVRLERMPPLTHSVRLEASDAPGTVWVLGGEPSPDQETVATVTGTAEDLLLALWRRAGLEHLTVTGDVDAVRRTFGLALTP